jgi:uncharacterized RDD family membrane protein YckC
VIDSTLIACVDLLVGGAGVVIAGVLHLPSELDIVLAAIGGFLAIVGSVGYFVGFWCTTGQTLGNRAMQIQVQTLDGRVIKLRRGLLRCLGLVVAALPLFAGYALILFDSRRRGLQDRLARTVVVHTPQVSLAAARRSRRSPRLDDRPREPISVPLSPL